MSKTTVTAFRDPMRGVDLLFNSVPGINRSAAMASVCIPPLQLLLQRRCAAFAATEPPCAQCPAVYLE